MSARINNLYKEASEAKSTTTHAPLLTDIKSSPNFSNKTKVSNKEEEKRAKKRKVIGPGKLPESV